MSQRLVRYFIKRKLVMEGTNENQDTHIDLDQPFENDVVSAEPQVQEPSVEKKTPVESPVVNPELNCTACGGTGLENDYNKCPACGGTGRV